MLGVTAREGEVSLGVGLSVKQRSTQVAGERKKAGGHWRKEPAGDPEDRAVDGEGSLAHKTANIFPLEDRIPG